MLLWFYWLAAIVLLGAGIYGLHRFCLHLEQRGYMYYLHTKPQGSGGGVFLDLSELIQPSVRHVIEVKEDKHIQQDAAGNGPEPEKPSTDHP